jgi:hypothetical protein
VKCFVRITKSFQTFILHSQSNGRLFHASCVSAEQVLVISVILPPFLVYVAILPACLGRSILTALEKERFPHKNQTSTESPIFQLIILGIRPESVIFGATIIPSQFGSELTTPTSLGIFTSAISDFISIFGSIPTPQLLTNLLTSISDHSHTSIKTS